jgi:FAD/FMN-containing dehydrogenase/glycerophosphoryl diester phosphodiesterase
MKINRILKISFSFCCILLGIYLFMEPIYTPTAILSPAAHSYFPQHIAHKALVSNEYSGNTLGAIEEALASYVEGIEIDIRLSKDGVPFLYHGELLEEATNGYGSPENYNWQQLQQLTYSDDHCSKLVSLNEVFEVVGSQKYIFLDIKTNRILNAEFSKKIVDLIRSHCLQESVIVETFNPFFLASMRLKGRDILLMYDFTLNSTTTGEGQQQLDKLPWLLKQPFFQKQIRRIIRPDILGPRYNLKKNTIRSFIDKGYPVISWTVDDPEIAYELFEIGVKGIQSNQPLQLLECAPFKQQLVSDAGGTRVRPSEIVHVKNIQDIIMALDKAQRTQKKITIAGRRHTMGGQALLDDSIQLNMLGLDHVIYNPEKNTVIAGGGATWKKIQHILNQHGRSVKVMQSDNIFSVGGSISVNVHGWQVGVPPIASTVLSITIVTADGEIRHINSKNEPELFKAVFGGFGLFGVIVEIELETVPNSNVTFHAKYLKPENFLKEFEKHITKNRSAELAYGRLRVDQDNLLEEIGLFWYEKTDESSLEEIKQESIVSLKRMVFRLSEYLDVGKKLRWKAEKAYANTMTSSGAISRNNAMNSDSHILWPLYGKNKDILHEYFVPKNQLPQFLDSLRKNVIDYNMNILNVTIRDVSKDNISTLPYAKQDMFAFVCLFSQKQEFTDEAKMKEFTEKVIDDVLKLNGSFYLPYRLHYTQEQLSKAYPEIGDWINLKRKWDPKQVFDSEFYQYVSIPYRIN